VKSTPKSKPLPAQSDLLALRERSRALDAAWLGTLAVALLSVAVAWFLRALDIDLSPVVWSVFAFALVHFLGASAVERLRSRMAFAVAVRALRACSVVLLAVLWHMVGGLDNPSFLLLFLVPSVASAVLAGRGEALLTATLSLAAALAVASGESAELRWYLFQLGLPLEELAGLLSRVLPARPEPFPGLSTGPAFQLTLLLVFGVTLPASVLLAERLVRQRLRLAARERGAGTGIEGEGLFQAAIREEPIPTVLVYADTAQIVEASRSFVNQMLLDTESIQGRTLFDRLAFAEPEAVRALLGKRSAELPFCAYRVGAEERVARVRSYRVHFGEETYACLSLADQNELFYLSSAFDALREGFLVIRDDREIAYFNSEARRLFPGLHFGMDAGSLLDAPERPREWWVGDGGETVHARLSGRAFEVRSLAARPPGSAEDLRLVCLRPVSPESVSSATPCRRSPMDRSHDVWRRLIAGVVLALCAGSASAQQPEASRGGSSNTLFVGTQLVSLSTGPAGGAGDVEWLHSLSSGASLKLGASSHALAGARWTYARAGATLKPGSRATLHAEADLGRGADAGRAFSYRAFRGGLAYEVIDTRLVLEAEDQLVDIHGTVGNVVKLGFTAIPWRSLSAKAAVQGTTSGNVDARCWMLRLDHQTRRFGAFAGVSAGRSRPVLLQIGVKGPSQALREVFGGASIPVGRLRVVLALDLLELGSVRRGAVLMSWRVPI
jgi:PAS domain-containing protein